MSVEITRETITPERAKELLAMLSPHQRKCTKPHAAMYVRDMAAGLWNEEVPQPIMISDEGNLLDGQHRLQAVVATGKPIEFYVAYGVPEASFSHIDIGRRRTAADFYCGANRTAVVALARIVGAIEAGTDLHKALGGYVKGAAKRLSDNEVLLVAQRHEEELQAAVRLGVRLRDAVGRGSTSGYALAAYLAAASGEPIDELVDDFASDQAILTVRTAYRRLVRIEGARTIAARAEICGVVLYGVHALACGNQDVRRVQEPLKFLARMSDYYTAPIREAAQ